MSDVFTEFERADLLEAALAIIALESCAIRDKATISQELRTRAIVDNLLHVIQFLRDRGILIFETPAGPGDVCVKLHKQLNLFKLELAKQTQKPILPFEPESVESMMARLPQALVCLWDPTKPEPDESPSTNRKYTFDFESGVRLRVSRVCDEGREFMHVSAAYSDHLGKSIETLVDDAAKEWNSIVRGLIPIGPTPTIHKSNWAEQTQDGPVIRIHWLLPIPSWRDA